MIGVIRPLADRVICGLFGGQGYLGDTTPIGYLGDTTPIKRGIKSCVPQIAL